MKRIIITIFVFLICLSSVSAVKVVYLTDKIDKIECNKVINSIPNEYYSEVSRIVIYDKLKNNANGIFSFPSKQISLDSDYCDREIIKHELAHSFQWKDYGKSEWICIKNHCGHWQEEWNYASKI